MKFAIEAYAQILQAAIDNGWEFANFQQAVNPQKRQLYLRHDVDISLRLASKLAALNHQFEVQSTFFLMLRSAPYNLLNESSLEHVEMILSAHQRIGFHCALPQSLLNPHGVAGESITNFVHRDFAIFQSEIPSTDSVFSLHDTTPHTIEWGLSNPVTGLINTYSQELFRDIPYYSDSNLRNDSETITRLLQDDACTTIQLLIHPEIWVAGGDDIYEVFARCWPAVIQELEPGVGGRNRLYQQRLPEGMPPEFMNSLRDGLLQIVHSSP